MNPTTDQLKEITPELAIAMMVEAVKEPITDEEHERIEEIRRSIKVAYHAVNNSVVGPIFRGICDKEMPGGVVQKDLLVNNFSVQTFFTVLNNTLRTEGGR